MINLLTPPIFDDEDKTLVAHHLFIIVWTLMAVGLLAIFIAAIIPKTVYRWLLVVGVIESVGLILLAINKCGHTRLVSTLLLFVTWAIATGMALTGGGISSNAMALYFIVVLIAGLVLSGRAGIITAGLCSLTGLFLVYLEYKGALPMNRVPHTSLTLWIANTIYMAIIISLQYLVSQTIRKALKQSRRELKERQQVAAALRESEARFRVIFAQAAVGVAEVEMVTGRFLTVNRCLCEMVGRTEEEMLATTFQAITHPEDLHRHEDNTALMMAEKIGHYDLQKRYIRKDGAIIWVNLTTSPLWNLGEAPTRNLIVVQDITERRRAQEALKISEERYRELSIIDELTQLYNSRHFYSQLKMEIDRPDRYEQPLTLLLLDLDNFKTFNDTYGHVEGDQVLWRLGQVVKRCLRETDSAYRYGGEEFTILLPMTTSEDGAVIAERIRTEFKKETFSPVPGQHVHVTVSIGLAQYKPQEDMKVFVHRVDQLMYQGKKNGKDRVCSEP